MIKAISSSKMVAAFCLSISLIVGFIMLISLIFIGLNILESVAISMGVGIFSMLGLLFNYRKHGESVYVLDERGWVYLRARGSAGIVVKRSKAARQIF